MVFFGFACEQIAFHQTGADALSSSCELFELGLKLGEIFLR